MQKNENFRVNLLKYLDTTGKQVNVHVEIQKEIYELRKL